MTQFNSSGWRNAAFLLVFERQIIHFGILLLIKFIQVPFYLFLLNFSHAVVSYYLLSHSVALEMTSYCSCISILPRWFVRWSSQALLFICCSVNWFFSITKILFVCTHITLLCQILWKPCEGDTNFQLHSKWFALEYIRFNGFLCISCSFVRMVAEMANHQQQS